MLSMALMLLNQPLINGMHHSKDCQEGIAKSCEADHDITFSDDGDCHRVVLSYICAAVTNDTQEAHCNILKLWLITFILNE